MQNLRQNKSDRHPVKKIKNFKITKDLSAECRTLSTEFFCSYTSCIVIQCILGIYVAYLMEKKAKKVKCLMECYQKKDSLAMAMCSHARSIASQLSRWNYMIRSRQQEWAWTAGLSSPSTVWILCLGQCHRIVLFAMVWTSDWAKENSL